MPQKISRNQICLFVNGQEHFVSAENAFLPLAQYLRYKACLPGTKVVCAEGDCGACTVLVAPWKDNDWSHFQSVNSCIAPVYLFDLASVVSIEGLEFEEELNEVQNKMREFHGGQCGYCTPGIVCALSGLAEKSHTSCTSISEKKARNHLTGNLCRCTGYEPILNAAVHVDLSRWQSLRQRYLTPKQKQLASKLTNDNIELLTTSKGAHLPRTIHEAVALKKQIPEARLVAGATDLGVVHNKGKLYLDHVIALYRVMDLPPYQQTAAGMFIPATMTLSEFEEHCSNDYPELHRLLKIFASPQIKNQGTLMGNLMNGSPIGDTLPPLLVLNAELHLHSLAGLRKVPLTSFYKGYKQMDIAPDEIALGVHIPKLESSWAFKSYKVSVRKDLDISAVTFSAVFHVDGENIKQARIALGGVGPTVVRLTDLENELLGKEFSEKTLQEAGRKAKSLIKPISDLRASEDYRLKVVENLFQKFFHEVQTQENVCP